MKFQKLALASAIAMAPTVGFSMTEVEDEYLSDVTGQEGIEMVFSTTSAVGGNIYIHDKDGLGAAPISAGYSWDGAIVVEGFSYNGNMTINIDAGDNAQGPTGAPTLNINLNIPSATIITGAIKVANSQRDDAAPGWGINTTSATLLNTMTIALTNPRVNIQLGNEPQGNMIFINATLTNGLTMNSFAVNDANSGGAIGASAIYIKDTGASADLQVRVGANATSGAAGGLVLTVGQLGSTTGMDIRMADVYLGSTAAGYIGDVTIQGLNLIGASLTISGK